MAENKKQDIEQTVEISKDEISAVKKKVKYRTNKLTIFNGLLWTVITVAVVGLLFFTILLINLLSTTPKLDVTKFDNLQSSQIYDSNNELIAEVGKTLRENVTYDELPSVLVDAFVACEDSRYFSHNGFDASRFIKAAAENVLRKLHLGGSNAGGSTMTMQLVKNTYFTDDDTGTTASRSGLTGIKRKFQEIKLAMQLEETLSKEQILELYVNKLNYGANGRGIQNAANYYFDKDVKDLTLSEAALLVGTINAPTYYNPFYYLDNATNRRDNVLYLMYYHGYITKEEYNLATQIKVEDLLADPTVSKGEIGDGNPYQAYIDAVISEVTELTGVSPYSQSMKIYTAMNKGVQNTIDEIQAGNTGGKFEWPDELMEVASCVIDNDTGEIVGILGGRNYSKGGTLLLNHATQQYKQPGSSIKPLVEYALAFDRLGWATSHYLTDAPYNYVGTEFIVSNYNNEFYGEVTVQEALSRSLNSPALQAMQELMYDDRVEVKGIVEYMNSMGYDQVTTSNFDVQYAIGGSTLEVTVVQQAAAQAAIMNGGVYHKPHTIRKIEYIDGTDPVIPTYDGVQTLSEEAAYMVADCLAKNIREAHSYSYPNIRSSEYTMYGKSGTSNWGSEAAQYNIPVGSGKDSWINASNVDYTVCTWVGYEKAIADKDTYMSVKKRAFDYQGKTTKLIFNSIDEHLGKPQTTLKQPSGVVPITHLAGTNVSGNKNYPYVSADGVPETVYVDEKEIKLVANGLIKKENYSLISAADLKDSAGILQDIKSFNAEVKPTDIDSNGHVILTLTWEKYPDSEKFDQASSTMKLPIINKKDAESEATGNRAFDWSWIYGSVVYRADITINGETQTVTSSGYDNNTLKFEFDAPAGAEVEVSGYYAFESSGLASNKIKAQKITIKEPQLNINYVQSEFEDLIKKYDLKVTREYVKDDVYIVYKDGSTVTSETGVTLTNLKNSKFVIRQKSPYNLEHCKEVDTATGACKVCENDEYGLNEGVCEVIPVYTLTFMDGNTVIATETNVKRNTKYYIKEYAGLPADTKWQVQNANGTFIFQKDVEETSHSSPYVQVSSDMTFVVVK